MIGFFLIATALVLLFLFFRRDTYDSRGFDRKGLHRNGTHYDDSGYDVQGYDREGYDRLGYDTRGYDRQGYNRNGYNHQGKNKTGQYNRLFDMYCEKDGLSNPRVYPIIVTNHARERMAERMPAKVLQNTDKAARDAFCYGRSKRQLRKSAAALAEEIERRYENSVVLVYHGYIYIFSGDNKLITVYQNTKIPL